MKKKVKKPIANGKNPFSPKNFKLSPRHLLGEIVLWDIAAKGVPVLEIRDALKQAGLDPSDCPDLHCKDAFKRAMRELKKSRLVDELDSSSSEISFQITHKERTSNAVLFHAEDTLVLNTTSGEVTSPAGNVGLALQATTMLKQASDLRSGPDISRLIGRMFYKRADLFPLSRKKGVAYFVPIQHRDYLDRIDKFLECINASLDRWPVPMGTEQGNAAVRNAIDEGLEQRATELQEAIAEWDKTTRKSTKAKMWKKVQALEFKLTSYASYLGSQQTAAHERVKELKKEAFKLTQEEPEQVPA